MSAILTALELDQLSVAERMLLVEEIWDSIAADVKNLPITEIQKADLQRRLTEYDASGRGGSTWDEVKARMQSE